MYPHCDQKLLLLYEGALETLLFTETAQLLTAHVPRDMSRATAFPTRSHMRPAKTQISLRICCSAEDVLDVRLPTNCPVNPDFGQTARMHRLI